MWSIHTSGYSNQLILYCWGLFIYIAKNMDFMQKSGISAKILDFSRPRTKNLDFGGRPLCAPWNPGFLPSGFAKNLDFMQKIGISCKKAGFHRCLKSHFFAIPTARGRPRWNPWKMTLKSRFFAEIQLFCWNPYFLHEIQLFCKTRWRGPRCWYWYWCRNLQSSKKIFGL